MLLSELLEKCAELEERIESLYEQFGATFGDDRELSSFWSQMAAAERGHAALLQSAAVNAHAHRLSVEAGTFRLIQSYVSTMTSWRPHSTLNDALGTALDLEELELDCVHSALLRIIGEAPREDDPRENEEHVELLLRMIERRSAGARLNGRAAVHRLRRRESRADVSVGALLAAISKRICYSAFRG